MRRVQNRGHFRGGHMPLLNTSQDEQPYMVEYLQNIDRELDQLKRKRELLEQQHGYFIEEPERKRPFSSPFYQSQYDDPVQSHSSYVSQQPIRKRPSPWQDESIPKRFVDYHQDDLESSYGSRLERMPAPRYVPPPKTKMTTKQKWNNPRNSKPANPIVSKQNKFKDKGALIAVPPPKKFNPPNSQNVKPIPRRGQFPKSSATTEYVVLDEKSSLDAKVRGRLELALGQILKSLKGKMNSSDNVRRVIKETIRDRIKKVMLGKRVGPPTEIIAEYRNQYPVGTDELMVQAATESVKPPIKLVKADDPQSFLKANVSNVVTKKLYDLFKKFDEIKTSKVKNKGTNIKSVGGDDKAIVPTDDHSGNFTFTVNELEEEIKRVLPNILKKYIPYLTKQVYADLNCETRINFAVLKTRDRVAAVVKNKPAVKPKEVRETEVKTEVKTGEATEETTTEVTETTESPKPPFHFAMVIGHPVLPRRNAMKPFLADFEPKSIKKHKWKHNLLFIGFPEEEKYNDFLKKDGVNFGKITLEIKPSEPIRSKGNGTTENCTITESSSNKNFDSDSNIISQDIDKQIDELLTSINNSDDENLASSKPPNEDSCKTAEEIKQEPVTEETAENNSKDENKSAENTLADTDKPADTIEKSVDNSDQSGNDSNIAEVTEKSADTDEKSVDITEKKDGIPLKPTATTITPDVTEKQVVSTEKNDNVSGTTENTTENLSLNEKTEDSAKVDDTEKLGVTEKSEDKEEEEDASKKTSEITEITDNGENKDASEDYDDQENFEGEL